MLAKITGAALLILGGVTVIYLIYKVILAWSSAEITRKREIEQLKRFEGHPEELSSGKPQNNLPLIDHDTDDTPAGPHSED